MATSRVSGLQILVTVYLVVITVPSITASVSLVYPPARQYAFDFLDTFSTTGPCGMPKGNGPVTTWYAGETYSVKWSLGYPHRGGIQLEILNEHENDTALEITYDRRWRTGDTTRQFWDFQIPSDFTCEACTLRLRRQALEWGDDHIFRSCADIQVLPANQKPDKCTKDDCVDEEEKPKGECRDNSDCHNGGACYLVQQYPLVRRYCYCVQGFFGNNCDKVSSVRLMDLEFSSYTKTSLSSKVTMYHKIIQDTAEIEIALKAATSNWVGIGFRSQNVSASCKNFPEPSSIRRNNKSQPGSTDTEKPDYHAVDGESRSELHPMDCTDMIIASARGQTGRVGDFYARGRSTPQPDSFYGYDDSLTGATAFQYNGSTYAVFRRKLEATEPTDTSITDSPIHVIWAIGQEHGSYIHYPPFGLESGEAADPNFYRQGELKYHGHNSHRGSTTVNFLNRTVVSDVVIHPHHTYFSMFGATLYNITCTAQCQGFCNYTWTRFWDGVIVSTSPVLSIGVIGPEDKTQFTCTVKDTDGHTAQGVLSLIPNWHTENSPKITDVVVKPAATYYAFEGVTQNDITCSAKCPGTCKYRWTRDWDGTVFSTSQTLSIGTVTPEARGTYTCTVTDSEHIAHAKFEIIPSKSPDPPSVSDIQILPGSTHKALVWDEMNGVTCTAKCIGHCRYQWLRDNVVVTNSILLPIKVVKAKDFGSYTCIVTNSNKQTVRGSFSLLVSDIAPSVSSIVIQPSATYFALVSSIASNITCTATCLGFCSYKWTRDWDGYVVSTSPLLSLGVVGRDEVSSYTCTVTHSDGRSADGKFSIIPTIPTVGPSTRLDVKIYPTSVYMALIGWQMVDITCTAKCIRFCQYKWTRDWDKFVVSNTPLLSVGVVGPEDVSSYTCTVTDSDQQTATGKFSIIPDIQTVMKGEGALIMLPQLMEESCELLAVKNDKDLKHPLFCYDGTHLNTEEDLEIAIYKDGQPVCEELCVMDAVTIIMAAYGDPSTITDVVMNPPHGVFSLGESQALVRVIGRCSAKCSGTCSYRWTRDRDGALVSEFSVFIKGPILYEDKGTYTCSVTDTNGQVARVKFQILPYGSEDGPPSVSDIEFSPETVNVPFFGEKADDVTCSAKCMGFCKYRWSRDRDDAVMSDTPLLSLLGVVDPDEVGSYTCTATNKAGQIVQRSFYVTVEMPMVIYTAGATSLTSGIWLMLTIIVASVVNMIG